MDNVVSDITSEEQIKILQEEKLKVDKEILHLDKQLDRECQKTMDLERENILLKEQIRDYERRIKIMENLADEKNLKIIKLEAINRLNDSKTKKDTITIPISWIPTPMPLWVGDSYNKKGKMILDIHFNN